jgi:hypothetical protein
MPAPAPLATQPGPALGSAPIAPSERMPGRSRHSTLAPDRATSTSKVHCPLSVTPYPSTATAQPAVHTGCTLPAPAQRMAKQPTHFGLPLTPSRSTPPYQHSTPAPQTEPQSTSKVHCPLTVTPYPSTASTQSVVHTGCTLPVPAQKVTKAANTLGLPRTPSRSTPPHQHSAHAPDRARSTAESIARSQSPLIPAQSLYSLLFIQAAH